MASLALATPAVGLVMPLASQQGGAENLFLGLLRAGSRSLRYTCLFLQDGPIVEETRALGYEAAVVRTTHLSDLSNYAGTVRAIRRWIREARLDVVFSWMQKAHLYAAPAAPGLGAKRMWFQHGISKHHWMDIAGACLPADGILCCSRHVKETQDQRFPSHPTFPCHPGVVTTSRIALSRMDARMQLGLPRDGQVICMVARLERWKGAHVFVEAASRLASKFPEAIFCIVGGAHPLDEPYAEEIRRLAKAERLNGRLWLAGQRPAQEIPLWHASANIIAHPVIEAEPFGMAIVEALAAGRAVIASNIGGINEILEDGVSGIFVPAGNAGALADAVSGLLQDADTRERIEAAARVRAQAFSIEAFANRFETLLSAVLAG